MPEKISLQSPSAFNPQYPEIRPAGVIYEKISAGSNNRHILSRIKKGEHFCFEGTWGTAMAFYAWLKKQVQNRYPVTDYKSSRIQREKLNALTETLFLPIKNHKPDLAKAPGNPWLKDFYAEEKEFYLRFTDYLGMNGARQWYEKGIRFPGLSHSIHPYFGTYFPTRTEHLEMFDKWLSENKTFSRAVDMGTGCGVLSFYLLKHRIREIIATDINPNALLSLAQELERNNFRDKVKLMQTSFFEGMENQMPDLVVFNPPWLPLESRTVIDRAMYYDAEFFDTFFLQAYTTLSPHSLIVILFSDFARAAGIAFEHPIEKEISGNNRFALIEKQQQSIEQVPSARKNWLASIREKENAELWVVRKKNP